MPFIDLKYILDNESFQLVLFLIFLGLSSYYDIKASFVSNQVITYILLFI